MDFVLKILSKSVKGLNKRKLLRKEGSTWGGRELIVNIRTPSKGASWMRTISSLEEKHILQNSGGSIKD
ncbi:hypothetical protein [Paenibacillus sp. UASWS1643]|uniref:hypothetical protein n=1 Tax=Paenibacillus sp. UASWS1643 TaxID=2580422 RepID=UPI001684B47B|nr:hypothetical protein [Paenibacillus sp. UASWS1643]